MHVYDDHIEALKEQVNRPMYKFPKLFINDKYLRIEDYKIDDFKIKNYKYNNTIKMNMRV